MDDIIKDVPVVMTSDAKIITEEYPFPPPKGLQKGRFMALKFIIPAAITGMLFILGFALGLFDNQGLAPEEAATRLESQQAFTFWVLFFIVSWFSVLWVRARMFASVQEAHKVTQIDGKEHKKLVGLMFGPASIIMIAIFAAVLVIYDFNAFGVDSIPNLYRPLEVEGWLWDSGFGDDLYTPYYVNEAVAILILVTWWIGSVVSAMFCWYAIVFLIYSEKITRKYTYRNEASVVKQLRLTDDEEKAFISVSYGFIPYITIKSIAQIFPFLVPWWADTIVTGITVAFFVLLLILPVKHIEKDLKVEAKDEELVAKAKSILSLVDLIKKVESGEELSLKGAVMALLYASYLNQIKDFKSIVGKNNTKILGSLMGPVASNGAKVFGAGGMPF